MEPLYVIVVFAAFGGFFLAFYIHHKKRKKEKMVCLLGMECEGVIYSEFSKFLGMPVELLGMAYYTLIGISYGVFLILPNLISPSFVFLVLAVTTAALLFSAYLTFIQAVLLKQWCSWCLISAGICTVIFFSALFGSGFGFIPLLAEHHLFIAILHILGVALGLGGVTFTDIFFFKFLKDLRISDWEADILHTLSQVIWFALIIIVVTGISLYLPEMDELNQSPWFLVKLIIVAVIIVNGAFLNLFISPKLVKISFGKKHDHKEGELHLLRKAAFALGAISLTSWYSVFILGMWNPNLSFGMILTAYLSLIGLAIIISQFVEERFYNKV